jgi:spermidine/putrescine transport system permease protein
MSRRAPILAHALLLPVLAWLIVFVVAPTAILLVYSFCQRDDFGRIVYRFTFANYREMLAPYYLRIFIRSLWYAGLTTAACAPGGLSRCVLHRALLSAQARLAHASGDDPLLDRIRHPHLCWITILSGEGLLSGLLRAMHVIAQPLDILYTPTAVVIGLVYTYLPFMILPIYTAAEKLDESMIEAASDLGANPFRAFWRVILPLTWSGVAGGIVLVFVPAVGMFAVSDLLGGARTPMIGNVIANQFGQASNAPFGAALGMVMLALFGLAFVLLGRRAMDAAH